MTRMIPMIRDLSRVRPLSRLQPACARPWTAAALLPLSSASAFVLSFVFLFFTPARAGANAVAFLQQSQNSNPKPAPAPAAQQPDPASPKSSGEASKDAKPLREAVHKKKVITEDDLAKPAEPVSLSDADAEENNSICDLSCEAELRAEMGFTPDRELEFRNQLTLARNEISNDHAWNSLLGSALDAARGYCDLQRHKAEILAKGNVAEPLRNNVTAEYAPRERELSSQYRNSEGYLTQRIAAVRRFASFRATIMQYEWDDAVNRACPDFKLP